MNPVKWAFAFTVLSRLISELKKRNTGIPSSINISGGEFSKFLITYFVFYLWMSFCIFIIELI